MWLKSGKATDTPELTEIEFTKILSGHSETELDMMLGLLINEQNRNYVDKGCSLRWLQLVEQLFFMLDSNGNGFITADDVHFFIISLLGDDAASLTPEQLLFRTYEFMKEVGPYEGVISLKRFKEFFLKNQIDYKAIHSTIQCIETEFVSYK